MRGFPLAMLLARKGYKVLLADKASFPSDIISTYCSNSRWPTTRGGATRA
jgi:hypothetical protein